MFRKVQQIDPKIAQKISIDNHYLHRKANCIRAYGLFEDEEIVGVCIFGIPASNSVCVGLFGESEKHKVLELVRLWIDDKVTNFPESYLVSQSLKLLRLDKSIDRDIIISYADTSYGHKGIIYQATNWIYYGLSDKHSAYVSKDGKHSRHQFDKVGGINKAKELGLCIKIQRPRKHRYLFLNTKSRVRKKELMSKFRYKIENYP